MSSREIWKTSKKQEKDSSETECHVDILRSPHGQRNVQTIINPTWSQPGTSGESHRMDWEITTDQPKSPPASLRSNVENIPSILQIEDIRNITTDLYKTKLSSDQSYSKPSCSYLPSPEKKNIIPRLTSVTMMQSHAVLSSVRPSESKAQIQNPMTMAETRTGLSTVGPSGSTSEILNPSVKVKTHNGRGTTEPPRSKALPSNTLEIPLRKQKIAETYELADACKYFLTFMKAKRTNLKYQEGQLDICTTDIQKALRDAEQVCFKLEAEPETIAEEMSAAITQSQKLAYLLSISYRCFSKLEELGTKLQESLQTYTNDSENFHLSVDRLLEYIIETIFEKCRQLGTL